MDTGAPSGDGDDSRLPADSADGGRRAISKDDVFHLLQNARRRATLRYMAANPDEQYEFRRIAETVAAWEHDTSVDELTAAQRQRVYIALYQSHLPKLAEHGVIEYDQDRGVVSPTRLLVAVDDYLGEGLHDDGELVVRVHDDGTRTYG